MGQLVMAQSVRTADEVHAQLERIWQTPPGVGALSAVNHSTIGLRFIVTGFVFFLIGGVLAMLLRTQLAIPDNTALDHEQYNAAFTLHGTAMMFFFAVPIMEGFAVYLLPKMIGARDLVFPRLSAFGYWCYLFGGILLFSSLVVGTPPDAGWFMYTPLSSRPYSGMGADFWLLGVTFAEISAVTAAVELIVSILKTRSPGMAVQRMPLFAWYIVITAIMIVFAFPPLILGSILLEIERAFGLPFFDPNRGGDPLLWQHLFWLFGHPEVYIIFLPAAGIVSTLVPTFARRPMAGYTWVVLAVIGTGFLSFGLWVHHMFATGIPLLSLGFFAAASMAVAIPSGIQVFAWLATLWNGRPFVTVPMLFILGFLFIFVLGGLTGVMVAFVPFDWQAHDSHFVVAHLHYVLFGGMVFPLFAGLYYWLPLVTGRVSEASGRIVFWLIFMGFNITFLPMHLTGLLGMPRRVYTYADGLGWGMLNLVSTVGGFLTAIGVAAFVVDFLAHLRYGRRASRNPWNAGTLEWSMRAPVPSYNFAAQPEILDREPLWAKPELPDRTQAGQGYLGHADPKRREQLVTGTVRAEPEHVVILPGNTFVPLAAALCLAVFFTGVLIKAYWIAGIGAAAALVAFLLWAWECGAGEDAEDRLDAGEGRQLPLHYASASPPGWWGMGWTIAADVSLFASLVFAFLYLWTANPVWPPEGFRPIGWQLPALAMGAIAAASALMQMGVRAGRRDRVVKLRLCLLAAFAAAAAFVVLVTIALYGSDLAARDHAYAAIVFALWGCAVIHVVLAMIMIGFVIVRAGAGYVGARRPGEARITALFWHYSAAQAVAVFAAVHVFPLLADPLQ
jgi:cytochrome c oxidase subunit I+III